MIFPRLPITRPGLSARISTLVPLGVRLMVSPPKPAVLVLSIRNSLTNCRSTFLINNRSQNTLFATHNFTSEFILQLIVNCIEIF